MMLNLFRTKKENGKTLFALLNENHFMGVERTLYIHSLSESPTNTIERKINDLRFFFEAMESQSVDVDSLASRGELPDEKSINLFIQAAKFKKKNAIEFISIRAQAFQNIKAIKLTDKQLLNIQYKPNNFLNPIGTKSVNKPLKIAASYLTFVFNHHVKFRTDKQELQLEKILGLLKGAERRRSKVRDDSAALKKTLTDKIFLLFLNLIVPTSKDNPFKGAYFG